MKKIMDEFVSNEQKQFKFKIGRLLASSLSGFIAGVLFSSLVWGLILYLLDLKNS